jgi:hypothetical protein
MEETEYILCPQTGKRCYSQKEANNVIHHSRNTKGKKMTPRRAYFCPYCKNYHLTHYKSFQKGGKTTKQWYRKAKENYKNHIGEEEI